jgi:hypothetical protein
MPSENPPAANVERVRAIYKTLQLLRVPTEKIVLAELAEAQRRLEATLANPGLPESTAAYIANAYHSPARNRSTVDTTQGRTARSDSRNAHHPPQRNSCRHERPPVAGLAPAPASVNAVPKGLDKATPLTDRTFHLEVD